ncbi:MAG TPA: Rid family hydrolase [Alphaproteobacteria bacterium]|jgi:enamine deaminase RidA (YjgF/YER057c/UK114 family)
MTKRKVTLLAAADGTVAGQLAAIDGMLFSSSIRGVDLRTGRLADTQPGQVRAAFANLRGLLEKAGASADAIGLTTVSLADPCLAPHVEEAWSALFAGQAHPPARKVNAYPLPNGDLVQIQVVGVSGQKRQSVAVPGLSAGKASGVRLGDMLFSSAIDGTDPATGRCAEDRKAQIRQAFRNMEALVAQAGGRKDDLAHIYLFIPGRDDQADMLDVWLEEFPQDGNRPARKAIFDESVARESRVIYLLCIAVLGGGRRVNLEVPGISKRHPAPMGCRLGDFLVASGIGGDDPRGQETDKGIGVRSALAFENMRTLMTVAGGDLADIGFVSILVNDYADEQEILRQWRRMFPDPADEPARQLLAFGGRGSYPVQLHVMAASKRS